MGRTNSSVVVTGSLAFDQIMNLPGVFSDYIFPDKIHQLNVSFLVDTLRKERGGTGGNIAYNLALLGIKVRLVAGIGSDGSDYVAGLKRAGIDVGGVRQFNDVLTAAGFVITDRQDNQIWNFYGGAMRRANKLQITRNKKQTRPDLVVIAPNDPQAMVQYAKECQKKNWEYLFDPAFYIPGLAKKDLAMAVAGAKIVIGNDYEITMLKRKIGPHFAKASWGKQIWITTLGEKGSVIRRGKEEYRIPAAKPKGIVDPTGAGDAYRAGFVAGYLQGQTLKVCGRMGSVCAAYTVEKYGTQTHKFSLREFKKRYETNFSRH